MAFDYKVPVPADDPSSKSSFTRALHHKDWKDGQDVVQAEPGPDDEGFNARFHRIEADLDALAKNVNQAFFSINLLRTQVVSVLAEIKAQFNVSPPKTSKDFKDSKDNKDGKDGKDNKDGKEGKDSKENKDSKDGKEGKDTKEGKESKEHKDGKEGKDTKEHEKIMAAKEKDDDRGFAPVPPLLAFLFDPSTDAAPAEPPLGRAFIRADERPPVGQRVIDESNREEAT